MSGLTVPLEVSGKDAQRCSFTLTTIATSLNRHGAMLHLNRDLLVDSVVVMQNRHGARISARVVAQTNIVGGALRVWRGVPGESDCTPDYSYNCLFPSVRESYRMSAYRRRKHSGSGDRQHRTYRAPTPTGLPNSKDCSGRRRRSRFLRRT